MLMKDIFLVLMFENWVVDFRCCIFFVVLLILDNILGFLENIFLRVLYFLGEIIFFNFKYWKLVVIV